MPTFTVDDRTDELTSDVRPERERVSLDDQRSQLRVDGIPDHLVGRWVSDVLDPRGNRIDRFIKAGWDFWTETKHISVGDPRVDSQIKVGDTCCKQVNRDGTMAYLMVIKKEWFDEDAAKKQAKVNETEESLHTEKDKKGMYGDGLHDKQIYTS
jgi:hypothetical protein